MAAFFKALDVTPLIRLSRKRGNTFNMLLCRCIGNAAGEVGVFICSLSGKNFGSPFASALFLKPVRNRRQRSEISGRGGRPRDMAAKEAVISRTIRGRQQYPNQSRRTPYADERYSGEAPLLNVRKAGFSRQSYPYSMRV